MATAPATLTDPNPAPAPGTPADPNAVPAPPAASPIGDLYPDDAGDPVDPNADPNAPQAGDPNADQNEGDQEPIAAPHSWPAEDKEKFAALPRDAQEIIARRETDRDRIVNQKAQEAAQAKQVAAQEARQAVQQIYESHVAELQRVQQLIGMPQPPDIRLLQSNDPQHHALYNEQDRQYKVAVAQHDQVQQQIQASRQQSEQLQQQSFMDHAARENAILAEKLPEWSDPSSRAKLLTDLQPIGQELGYSPEQMSQAGATDILALRLASTWKQKAEKYDALNKAKMVPVRAAKDLPPTARSGVAGQGQQGPGNVAHELYPNDVRR